MGDPIKPPVTPVVRTPQMDRQEAANYIEVGMRGCSDPLRMIMLYNTASKLRVNGPPPQLLPMLAAWGMAGAAVMQVVDRLCPPPREGATEEEIAAELPEWAYEVLCAVGVLSKPEPEEKQEEDLTARAARAGLVIGVG